MIFNLEKGYLIIPFPTRDVSPPKNVFFRISVLFLMNCFEPDAWWTLISMVHCVPGTLTVNVSVLLLSLASPDESSLVIEHFSLDNHFIMLKTRNKKTMHARHIFYIIRTHERCTRTVEIYYKRIYKRFIPSYYFWSTEIRGGVLAATTMVRPAITI